MVPIGTGLLSGKRVVSGMSLGRKNSMYGCKTREKFNFSENGKTVISVENRKFSRSRMTKQIAPLNSSREI